MPDLLSRDDARALAQRILERVTADGARVALRSERHGHTRYAVNQITTAGETDGLRAELTVRVGRRSASVTFNRFGEDAMGEAVARAQRLAQLAPEDPEQMPLLGPQQYADVPAYFAATAEFDAAARAEAVNEAVQPAAAAGLVATGFLERRLAATAVADTAGLFAYHRESVASHTTTVRTADGEGSGWAGTTHNDRRQMTTPADLGIHAIDKARRSSGVRTIEPGAYTVLLEPTAVGNLVRLVGFALDARAADEGRSFFAARGGGTKIGERVLDARLTLASNAADADVLERPFTEEGLPLVPTDWVRDGVLRHLAYERYWAERQGAEPRPYAGFLRLDGGAGGGRGAGDLLAGVERGLLVTRFWYIRSTDPRTISYTGLTRDGTFLIENGRLTRPVRNMRFNQSIVAMLNQVEAVGRAERVVASESGGLGPATVVPPLVVRGFRFTSVSDAV